MNGRADFGADLSKRHRKDHIFKWVALTATLIGFVALAILLFGVLRQGLPWLNIDFLQNFPDYLVESWTGGVSGTLKVMRWREIAAN